MKIIYPHIWDLILKIINPEAPKSEVLFWNIFDVVKFSMFSAKKSTRKPIFRSKNQPKKTKRIFENYGDNMVDYNKEGVIYKRYYSCLHKN